MARTTRQSGCIRWPRTLRGGGEGGIWVYAFWTAWPDGAPATLGDELLGTATGDAFICCHGVEETVRLCDSDAVISPDRAATYQQAGVLVLPVGRHAAQPEPPRFLLEGRSILAAVCLGSYGRVPIQHNGVYWYAQRGDLTRRGRRLLTALDTLYQRQAQLVTYLDT